MYLATITNLQAKLARQRTAAQLTEVQIQGFEQLQKGIEDKDQLELPTSSKAKK